MMDMTSHTALCQMRCSWQLHRPSLPSDAAAGRGMIAPAVRVSEAERESSEDPGASPVVPEWLGEAGRKTRCDGHNLHAALCQTRCSWQLHRLSLPSHAAAGRGKTAPAVRVSEAERESSEEPGASPVVPEWLGEAGR